MCTPASGILLVLKACRRNFQTTGVVAFARGCPISRLQAGKQDIGGHRIQVKEGYRYNCEIAIGQPRGKALNDRRKLCVLLD
jgi:hypothetical protein